MTKPKLTRPFPGTVKPMYRGVYRRRIMTTAEWWFARWDGWRWRFAKPTIEEALVVREASMFQNAGQWRGLAEKP